MTKTIKLLLCIACLSLAACSPKDVTESVKPVFAFHQDGTFKILQLTDVHIDWDNQIEYEKVYKRFCNMLDIEKPDLAIFTGDVVTESAGGEEPWEKLLVPFDERNIPFALEYGNHDRESDLMDTRMAEIITSHPSCVTTMSRGILDDNAIEIMSHDGKKLAAVLYVMDSGDYSTVPGIGGYGWFAPSQLRWYDDHSQAYRMANGGCPVPSYMFMHIPLSEYYQAYSLSRLDGDRGEGECPGSVNSGMFAHIKANADVHGVFVGHDHVNDYIADAAGVGLVYGRFSGGATTYTHSKQGLRLIQLKEGDYGFRSWAREDSGEVTMEYTYDPGLDYTLRKACEAEGKQNGALMAWYDGAESFEAMSGMTVSKETVLMPRHECRHSDGPHGFGYECFIFIPETGLWRFRTGDRENGCVKIDDVALLTESDNNVTEINLEKGYHKLDAKAWVKGGRSDFKLTWMAPSEDRLTDVPAKYFFVK